MRRTGFKTGGIYIQEKSFEQVHTLLIRERFLLMMNNMLNGDYDGIILALLVTAFIFSQLRVGKNIFTWIRFITRFVFGYKRLEGIQITNVNGNDYRYLMILGALTLLPNNVLALMKKEGVTISYGKSREGDDFSGWYSPKQNTIFIGDDGIAGNWGWQVSTIIHEVGHFVDFSVGYSVGYNRFMSIVDSRLHNIHAGEHDYYNKRVDSDYYTKNICEFFAQGFAEYFLVHNFKEECPQTSAYIKGILQSI